MSNFSERLDELIFDKGLSINEFAQAIGINASSISNYLNNTRLPTVANLVCIADFFQCSTDFLLGREEQQNLTFKPCPPFSERIDAFLKEVNCEPHDFYTTKKFSKSRYFEWKKGTRQPSLDNMIRLAEAFDCRVDFILGRE